MLAGMRRKGNPPTLLVGMQAGAATLENSMEVPQKVENRATLFLCSFQRTVKAGKTTVSFFQAGNASFIYFLVLLIFP